MAAVTREQVRTARAEGHAAGYALTPSTPNPYAPPHVPAWQGPRTPAAAVDLERRNAGAVILAKVWRAGHQAGLADYGRDKGLAVS